MESIIIYTAMKGNTYINNFLIENITPDIGTMDAIIGGNISSLILKPGIQLIYRKEQSSLKTIRNSIAARITRMYSDIPTSIYGNVLICGVYPDGSPRSLSDKQIKEIKAWIESGF